MPVSCACMMLSSCTPLALKKPLKLTSTSTTTGLLLMLFFLVSAISVGSCEARRLHVRVTDLSEPPPPPCDDLAMSKHSLAGDDHGKETDRLVTVAAAAKEVEGEGPSGAVRNPRAAAAIVRVSRELSHGEHSREDPGFHLDYAGPRTHPPSHN